MIEIILATRNRHKCLELAQLLRLRGVRWRSLEAFPDAPPVREDGATFRENAIKKACQTSRSIGRLVVADDSGLEVDALRGGPGVRSARFAGRHGDDASNNAKLLRVLRGVPARRRRARYRCVLALASPQRLLAVAEGVFEGRLATATSGTGGFGYDPLFVVPRLGRTVAEIPLSVKQRISHRAKAAAALRRRLAVLVTRERRRVAAARIAAARRSRSAAAALRG